MVTFSNFGGIVDLIETMRVQVKFLIFSSLFFIFYNTSVVAWRSFKIIFTSFPIEVNEKYVEASVKILNQTTDTRLELDMKILKDISEANFKTAIAFEGPDGNYTSLVNKSLNLCNFLKHRTYEPLLTLLWDDLIKDNNFIKTCPIKKGTYALRNYRLDEEKLPAYLAEGDFFVDVEFDTSKGDLILKGRLKGKIDKSKGFNNLRLFSVG